MEPARKVLSWIVALKTITLCLLVVLPLVVLYFQQPGVVTPHDVRTRLADLLIAGPQVFILWSIWRRKNWARRLFICWFLGVSAPFTFPRRLAVILLTAPPMLPSLIYLADAVVGTALFVHLLLPEPRALFTQKPRPVYRTILLLLIAAGLLMWEALFVVRYKERAPDIRVENALNYDGQTVTSEGATGWWFSKTTEKRAEALALFDITIPTGWVVDKVFRGQSFSAVVLFHRYHTPGFDVLLFTIPEISQHSVASMLGELDEFTNMRLERSGAPEPVRQRYLAYVGRWATITPTVTGTMVLPLRTGNLPVERVEFRDDPNWKHGIMGSIMRGEQVFKFLVYDRSTPSEEDLVMFLDQLAERSGDR